MPLRPVIVTILLVAFVVSSALAATRPARARQIDPLLQPYAQGLFWKITRGKQLASYIYGTMHLDVAAVTHLPPQANMAFARARVLVAEVSLDAGAQNDYTRVGLIRADQHLASLLAQEDYAALVRIANKYKVSGSSVDKMKPWLATNLIGRPRPRTGVVLDELLQQRATAMGKPIVYLETLAELSQKLDHLPIDIQLEILRDTITQHEIIMQQQAQELRAYLHEDLAGLLYGTARPHQNEAAFTLFNDVMLQQRTDAMVKRMLPELVRGNAFIAVGAAHLPGEHGLLRQIDQRGYRVSNVPLH